MWRGDGGREGREVVIAQCGATVNFVVTLNNS